MFLLKQIKSYLEDFFSNDKTTTAKPQGTRGLDNQYFVVLGGGRQGRPASITTIFFFRAILILLRAFICFCLYSFL